MLAYMLGLLKILGIILIILIAVLVLLSFIILFVPIRYDVSGVINERQKQFKATASWLLKLIRFKLEYIYPEKPEISLFILWFDLNKSSVPSNKSEIRNIKKKKHNKKNLDSPPQNFSNEKEQKRVEWEAIHENKESNEMSFEEENSVPQDSINGFAKKGEKILFKIKAVYDKIKSIIYNIQYYIDLFQEEDTKILLKNSWKSLYKILLSIKPKYFSLKLTFGFSTPDITGKVFGYYCMILPLLPNTISISPDFESEKLDGTLKCNGSITIFVILLNALRIIFDKRLQPLINKLRNGGKKDE